MMSEQEAVDAFLRRDRSSLEWNRGRRTWPRASGVPLRLYLKEVTRGNFDPFLIPLARSDVVEEKLKGRISEMLVEQDEEFRKYYAALKQADKETLAIFTAKAPGYLETMQQKWRRQQYAAATIEIFEESFAEVKKMLLRKL